MANLIQQIKHINVYLTRITTLQSPVGPVMFGSTASTPSSPIPPSDLSDKASLDSASSQGVIKSEGKMVSVEQVIQEIEEVLRE